MPRRSPKAVDAQSLLLGRLNPCLPTAAPCPPAGPEWLHEIKHDGYRMLAHRDGECARLISRRGLRLGVALPDGCCRHHPVVFDHACKLGCEGIVSKRRGSRYARGRTHDWLKVKNPDAPAVQREAEEHWRG